MQGRVVAGVLAAALLLAGDGAARVFYPAATWLETSEPVRRLSLQGVLHGWGALAVRAEREPVGGADVALARLHRCVTERGYSLDALVAEVTAFARRAPERLYASLSHFVAQALSPLCEGANGR